MQITSGLPETFNPDLYDMIVVGAGFAGAVCARRLAETSGFRVAVLERRDHIAGNAYDRYDGNGILVHEYGPHIYHTFNERVHNFLSRFTEWTDYQHKVLANIHGTLMPVPFNHTSLKLAFGEQRGEQLYRKLVETFGEGRKVPIMELRQKNDPDLQEVADYVYETEQLAQLHGKKLQAKRNHCNRFEAAYPDYRVLPLTADQLPRCRAFTDEWYRLHFLENDPADYALEQRAIGLAFDHFDALGMTGLVLEVEDEVVAFAMGNPIRPDVFDVNFEKARADMNGPYPMINREFARRIAQEQPQYRFLNREDDMGLEGLRRAKESYIPDLLLEKLLAEELPA